MLDKFFSKITKFVPAKWRRIFSHDGFKRYFSNTGWMFAGQMFSLLIAFFVGAWVARYLGPKDYGILNYAISFAGLFGFIASLGVDGILSRELVKFPEKRDELLGTGFRLKIIGGILAFLAASLAAVLVKSDFSTKVLIILFAGSFILQAINVISTFFQAEVKAKNNVKAQLVATIISSLLKIAAIVFNQGIIWIMIVYVLDFVWQGSVLVYIYRRSGQKISAWKFNRSLAKEIWKNSRLLMLAGAAFLIYLKIDQVMIGQMLGEKEVGFYAAAVKIAEIWYFIPGIICASLFPAIVNAKKTGEELYRRRLKNLYVLLAAISLAIALPISFLAKPLILIIFGGDYLAAAGILQIYIWSGVGIFLGSAIYQYLLAENMIKTIFTINLAAMIVNIALNLILIPRLGLSGAAWATLISYFVMPIGAAMINWFRRRERVFN